MKLRRVLVANRSEIACRLIRGVQESGREACTVFSEPDRSALHVRLADRAWPLGGATARESYLDAEKIIAAAKAMKCDAVHPGYGFLSEKHEFNEQCRKAGLVFIGPTAEAQSIMGIKTGARALAQRAGVPVAPGTEPLEAPAAIAAASKIGYPLLVKAAAGGGGKGMRRVASEKDLVEAVEGCRRDALSSFGDGRVYLERLIDRPRHVEIQVLGDRHGDVIYLGERECSVQRRHQKVIEESPSVALDAAKRKAMGEAACALAREVGYENAGTVEFLLDASGKFYFLEMNTRLQVEHPVTELCTGIDIVQAQLRIAEGEKLGIEQSQVQPRGWAIEGRVYAEDPTKGFLPGAGTIEQWKEPAGPGVRVDTGVARGSDVPIHYDPILAKLVVWAETRERALARFLAALDRFAVVGVPTTIPFLRLVAAHPSFREGDIATDFIDRALGGLDAVAQACIESAPKEDVLAAVAASLLAGGAGPGAKAAGSATSSDGSRVGDAASPWLVADGWRIQR